MPEVTAVSIFYSLFILTDWLFVHETTLVAICCGRYCMSILKVVYVVLAEQAVNHFNLHPFAGTYRQALRLLFRIAYSVSALTDRFTLMSVSA